MNPSFERVRSCAAAMLGETAVGVGYVVLGAQTVYAGEKAMAALQASFEQSTDIALQHMQDGAGAALSVAFAVGMLHGLGRARDHLNQQYGSD